MRLILSLVLTIGASATAGASIIFTLDSPTFPGVPGDTVHINGTLFNPDPDAIFLNNLSGFLASADLSFDLTDFFTVVPSVLNSGATYSGPIVAVLIDPLAQPGDFFGSITLQGGADPSAFDDLATQNFQVTVSDVPEPWTFSLVAASFAVLAAKRYCGRDRKIERG